MADAVAAAAQSEAVDGSVAAVMDNDAWKELGASALQGQVPSDRPPQSPRCVRLLVEMSLTGLGVCSSGQDCRLTQEAAAAAMSVRCSGRGFIDWPMQPLSCHHCSGLPSYMTYSSCALSRSPIPSMSFRTADTLNSGVIDPGYLPIFSVSRVWTPPGWTHRLRTPSGESSTSSSLQPERLPVSAFESFEGSRRSCRTYFATMFAAALLER